MPLPLVLPVRQLHQHLQRVSADNKSLEDAGLCLVDLRSAEAYAAGHIEGAVNASPALLNRSEPPTGGLMPEPESINRFMRAIGARQGDQIIAYDGGMETPAARLIWVMDAYGYAAGCWLSGGYRAWVAEGLPVSTESVEATAGTLELSLIGDNSIAVDELMAELQNPAIKILDVRSAGEYEGTDVRAAYTGHVPGAKHAEWTCMLDEHGQLLDETSLQATLKQLNPLPDDTLIVYCQTHQRSAVTYVALKHLGYNDVRAIDGAWSAWGNRPDTPKESGT